MRGLIVFGTRPEAIKMCPLVLEMKKHPAIKTFTCVTSQHRQMLEPVLDAFGVKPDYDLSIMKQGQTLSDITCAVLSRLPEVFLETKPDVVLVHGDTSTAYSSALSSFYHHIPIGHVEAGLRTHDMDSPYPEEFNRCSISLIAQYHFAPTMAAKANLVAEGHEKHIYVTGNTAIDALKTTVRPDYRHEMLDWAADSRLLLITAHRRENLGQPMREMFRAIRRIVESFGDVKAIYPVHMNPAVQQIARDELDGCARIRLIDPLSVIDFHNFLSRSFLVLTDSGGIQEEAPSLGVPVLVMRDTTERPEGVTAGTLKLVGTSESVIYRETHRLLTDDAHHRAMSQASNPYGDGRASERILQALIEELA